MSRRTRVSGPCEYCGAARPLNAKRFCSRACFTIAKTTTPADRFWPKVNKNGPVHPALGTRCWIWTGSRDQKGYGTFSMPPSKPAKAHRVAWALINGPVPPTMNVLHRCDVRLCVNVQEHLFLGSLADNNADMLTKSRARGPSLLNAAAVRLIRLAAAAGVTQREIAAHFGVVQTTVQAVVTRRTWKHVA